MSDAALEGPRGLRLVPLGGAIRSRWWPSPRCDAERVRPARPQPRALSNPGGRKASDSATPGTRQPDVGRSNGCDQKPRRRRSARAPVYKRRCPPDGASRQGSLAGVARARRWRSSNLRVLGCELSSPSPDSVADQQMNAQRTTTGHGRSWPLRCQRPPNLTGCARPRDSEQL